MALLTITSTANYVKIDTGTLTGPEFDYSVKGGFAIRAIKGIWLKTDDTGTYVWVSFVDSETLPKITSDIVDSVNGVSVSTNEELITELLKIIA